LDVNTQGYKSIRSEYNLTADGDIWGNALTWHFAVAETLFHNGNELPSEWKFRDSPMHSEWSPDDYETEIIAELLMHAECEEEDLLTFGHVLFRYLNVLKAAGKDY
jgi:hypothetical protein